MPTLYKPIVCESESVWLGPAEAISVQVFENRTEILETLNFHEVHGRLGDFDGKFDNQITKAGDELLEELAGIFSLALAQAAEPKTGVQIATLEWIRKHPSPAQDRTLPGFAERLLAAHYQRDEEKKGTNFPDIFGFEPNGFNGEMAVPNESAIRKAASAAIDDLSRERSAGCPPSEAKYTVAEGLRSILLRYNEKLTRHSVLTSKGGRLIQTEAGPLFESVSLVVLPLQSVLEGLGLKKISVNSLVHNIRYPNSTI